MTLRTRRSAIAGWVISLLVGSAVTAPLLGALGLSGIDDVPFLVAFTGPYVAGALFLLLHARHLTRRLRVSLVLSLAAIVASLVAPTRSVGVDQTAAVVMAVYISIASVPLMVVGIHNLAWSLGRRTPIASAP